MRQSLAGKLLRAIAGLRGSIGQSNYVAAKAGLPIKTVAMPSRANCENKDITTFSTNCFVGRG